jgi:hypothetical protein
MLRHVAAGQDPVAALHGYKDTRSENFAPLCFFSNDQAHRKIRDMRQNRIGYIVCHVSISKPVSWRAGFYLKYGRHPCTTPENDIFGLIGTTTQILLPIVAMADEDIQSHQTSYQLIGPSEDGILSDLLAGLAAKPARQRLQALIAEWLRMENLVVLTGAGTSVSSGGRTMITLEREVIGCIGAISDLPDSIGKIIKERTNTTGGSAAGIPFEDWLSYLANANFVTTSRGAPFNGVQWQGGANPSGAELSALLEDISKAIFLECALTLKDTGAASMSDIPPHFAFFVAAGVIRAFLAARMGGCESMGHEQGGRFRPPC